MSLKGVKTVSVDSVKSKAAEGEQPKKVASKKVKVARKESIRYPSHHHGNHKQSTLVCVKNVATGVVDRVARSSGETLVCSGSHTFAKKSEWRAGRKAKK